uniref:Uncharacterized protein n=1 Tax=Kalanchoe fedtschenkoi TaxID=63787 RepID=A0A7N0T1Q6_KALFE
MKSEVALLSAAAADFSFDSGCSTPYLSAPSSPARIPNFFHPDSQLPTRSQFPHLPPINDAEPTSPACDERRRASGEEVDFAFDSGSGADGQESVFAEELFDEGKIRSLAKTELETPNKSAAEVKKMIDFSSSISQDHRSSSSSLPPRLAHSHSCKGRAQVENRSFSPGKETVSFWEMFPFLKLYRKWKLKDLLFRSKSESRSSREAEAIEVQNDAVVRTSSLKSVESFRSNRSRGSICTSKSNRSPPRSVEVTVGENDAVSMRSWDSFRSNESGGSNRRRRHARSVSAHELHYTLNRTASEEMRRRTYLPYKQGLLGCLGFGNPMDMSVASRAGSMTRV